MAKIIKTTEEVIEGPMLISAYDIYFKKIQPPFDFASLVFLDSGGYEASRDTDLAELGDYEHSPDRWEQRFHEEVLANWSGSVPVSFISYDHPDDQHSIPEQIERARGMAPGRDDVMREVLLKPETRKQRFIDVDSLIASVPMLRGFDIVGITEKEIGNSILSRMVNIARFRRALQSEGLDVPIHVFGSLDTVTTPMYFLAGADIFDGLTWLRFAFHDGFTMYKHNYGALKLGVNTGAHIIDGRCWFNNYGYLVDLQLDMRRFLNHADFSSFRFHGDLFERAFNNMQEIVGE